MAVKSTGFSADQADKDARDLWGGAGAWTEDDRSRASTNRDTTGAAAGSALSTFGAKPVATNVGGWSPTEIGGYSPTQMQQWMKSITATATPTINKGSAVSAPTVNFKNENLAKFSAQDLLDFDPSAAGQEFARGAYGDFSNAMKDNLTAFDEESVAAGRLRTGQYDVNKGQMVTRMASDFDNRLSQAALEFSGQRLQGLTSGTGMNLQKAQSMDENSKYIAGLNAQLGLDASKSNANNDLTFNSQMLQRGALDMDRQKTMLSGAESADRLSFEKASLSDRLALEKATSMDSATSARDRTALEAALQREALYAGNYNTAADRSASYATANRQWADNDRQRADMQALFEKLLAAYGQSGRFGGGENKSVPNPNAEVAKAFGVPYLG